MASFLWTYLTLTKKDSKQLQEVAERRQAHIHMPYNATLSITFTEPRKQLLCGKHLLSPVHQKLM